MSIFRGKSSGLFLLFNILTFSLIAQEKGLIHSKFYCVKDYHAAPQNWAIIQDQRGVMYFGNSVGLLEFDGESWKLFKVPNKSTVRSLGIDKNGTVYVGAYGEMGLMQPDSNGQMTYCSLMHLVDEKHLDFKEVWDIHCFGDTVFYYSDNYIFRYHKGRFKYWESKTCSFYLSFKVDNEYLVLQKEVGLQKITGDSLQLIENGDFFSNIKIHSIFPIKNGYLIGTRHHGFFIYKNIAGCSSIHSISEISDDANVINDYFKRNIYYHGVKISDTLFALSSILGDILVVDNNWRVKDVINSEVKGVVSPNYFLYLQGGHNLWIALDNGISQVELMSPFRFWDESMGINGVISDVAQVNDYVYAATTSGIFYINHSANDFAPNRFKRVAGDFEQAWQFLYFQPPVKSAHYHTKSLDSIEPYVANKGTVLLAATLSGVFVVDGGKSTKISDYTSTVNLHQSYSNPQKLLVGMADGVAQLSYGNGKWINEGMKFGIDASVIDIGEDPDNNLWVSTRYKGIYRVKNPFAIDGLTVVERYDTSAGIPSLESISFFDEYNPFLLHRLGTNDFFYYIDSTKRFEKYIFPKEVIPEEQRKKYISDSILWQGIGYDVNSSYYVVDANDKNTWFSTSEGIFRCAPNLSRDFYDLPAAMIRKVMSGDSTIFCGTNIKKCSDGTFALDTSSVVDLGIVLKHKDNSLTFHYAWPFFEGNKPNQYSHMLSGYNNSWSEWSSETKKEYTNLHEGEYTFRVKAKNLYGVECRVAEFRFTVLPPWYRTYMAYFLYVVIGALFIAAVVKLYTYKLILEKNKLEQIVKERTQEVLIQNEEILVQAEHLKEANDWISAKNIELEAQNEEIERKKNQLEVSNATKNKFFRIIAHDLRNPISTLVGTTGYILTDFESFDKQKTKQVIQELNKLSLTTYGLLENLLDWSTSQMGDIQYNPTQISLKSVILENIELVKSKIDSKSIHIVLSVPENLNVIADENMLDTVVRNIITNAVKFTRDQGTISIYTKIDNQFCYLSIADDGIGISPDIIKKLFHVDKDVVTFGTHNEKGSGLGLILSKEFIERNGGAISVESVLGKGSTFTISIGLA